MESVFDLKKTDRLSDNEEIFLDNMITETGNIPCIYCINSVLVYIK
jgi:hypothetical protein